jgi:hypothetical protein
MCHLQLQCRRNPEDGGCRFVCNVGQWLAHENLFPGKQKISVVTMWNKHLTACSCVIHVDTVHFPVVLIYWYKKSTVLTAPCSTYHSDASVLLPHQAKLQQNHSYPTILCSLRTMARLRSYASFIMPYSVTFHITLGHAFDYTLVKTKTTQLQTAVLLLEAISNVTTYCTLL